MNRITPKKHSDDSMPYDVATAILTEPKAKISNTFRKSAKRAREKVYQSDVPLHRVISENEENHALWPLTNPAKPTPAAAKLQRKTLGQLARWLRRTIARRLVVQAAAVKMERQDTSNLTALQLRRRAFQFAALDLHAGNLDAMRELLEEELTRRAGTYNPMRILRTGVNHIDPQVRRRASILRAGDAAQ
jgi:hypothetical protein